MLLLDTTAQVSKPLSATFNARNSLARSFILAESIIDLCFTEEDLNEMISEGVYPDFVSEVFKSCNGMDFLDEDDLANVGIMFACSYAYERTGAKQFFLQTLTQFEYLSTVLPFTESLEDTQAALQVMSGKELTKLKKIVLRALKSVEGLDYRWLIEEEAYLETSKLAQGMDYKRTSEKLVNLLARLIVSGGGTNKTGELLSLPDSDLMIALIKLGASTGDVFKVLDYCKKSKELVTRTPYDSGDVNVRAMVKYFKF